MKGEIKDTVKGKIKDGIKDTMKDAIIDSINPDYTFDAIVVGAGHAGIEAGLALCRANKKTLMLTISLDNIGYLACNPSIGGTAKSHLVREIDALGGVMGMVADQTLVQLRMLNASKGYAVQSLRAQVDKHKYHQTIKKILEDQPNLFLKQAEATNIFRHNDQMWAIKTTQSTYYARVVILCCGVYLRSKIITGKTIEDKGPSSFARSEHFSQSLIDLGIPLRRFKTGTPARVKRDTIDLNQLEIQKGERLPFSFSTLSKKTDYNKMDCYLGYTNEATHEIIRQNMALTARRLGLTQGAGARYCPSIEDKIERFDKSRHQFFLEPEGENTQEMYVQGISTSLPADVQLQMYRSIHGFENVHIMRDAYAIEYDCIDPCTLDITLMHKHHKGLFFAGQINGTSGYEEAGSQGLVAGINASKYLDGEPPVYLTRDNSYIGVMIDDLITKGADEPYRIMTSRADFRLHLRCDNADLRLSPIAIKAGLISGVRLKKYQKKVRGIQKIQKLLGVVLENGMTLEQFMRRHDVSMEQVLSLEILKNFDADAIRETYIALRYSGYLAREERIRHEQERLNGMIIDPQIDYSAVHGLRIEAVEKLNKIRPLSIGQALRISGVNPADINVLIVWLKRNTQA